VSLSRLVLALTVFLSAFLVFQIQPLISKYILPWYGGTAAVWTTCLLLFQMLLFAGYAYAHLVARLRLRVQTVVHLSLLVVASLVSIVPADSWKPAGDEDPLTRILLMLLATVGLPYFALSATGPLVQAWFWRVFPGRSPYPLYALSNGGSLLALLSYPLLVEPFLGGRQQAAVWRTGFVAFALLSVAAAWRVWRSGGAAPEVAAGGERPSPGRRVSWIAWSACGVVLFMAVTNQLTLNVASVPFLWVVPLSVYLVAFIVAFSGDRGYSRAVLTVPFAAALVGVTLLLELDVRYTAQSTINVPILVKIGVYVAALFVFCLVCHGELYRLRPAPRYLTSFYLSIAFGGALGGITVGVVAPLVFLLYQELQIALLGCSLLYLLTLFRDPASRLHGARPRWVAVLAVGAVLLLAGAMSRQSAILLEGAVSTRRNFFGVLRVREVAADDPVNHAYTLFDGAIVHGHQYVRPDLRTEPTTYYSRKSGVGRVLTMRQRKGDLRIGVIGLGIGTLAAYGRPGDYIRFYEINPFVVDAARNGFSYLADSAAEWDVALGDARLKMEQESPQQFDFLVLDAFSSDSIPVHLLTAEAFDVYERHLAPGGVIAINISNLHLELSTVVYRHAEARKLHALEVRNSLGADALTMAAAWMFVSRNSEFMNEVLWTLKPAHEAGEVQLGNRPRERHADVSAWTDNYSSLLRILK